MKPKNDFDDAMDTWEGKAPAETLDALRWVVDSLDLAWKGARAVFEESARPEHAVAVVDLVIKRMAATRSASESDAP